MVTTKQLRDALSIAEQIEQLQGKLTQLLSGEPQQDKGSSRSREIWAARQAAEQRDLAFEVGQVLKHAGKPVRVAEIYDRLQTRGYKFSGKEPKKMLAARIYKLRGVKKVGEGLFTNE